jgi:beta-glucosidase
VNFTTDSAQGQLQPGSYSWTGDVFVPSTDTYTFRFQFSPSVAASNVTFSLDGTPETLSTASDVYGTGVTGAHGAALPGSPTNAGETEQGLTNEQFSAGTLIGGSFHQVTITFDDTTSAPASFRFAYSRLNGDIADAAAAAKGKKLAIVFLSDQGASTTIANPYGTSPATISAPGTLSAQSTALVDAVSAANPNTVVVLNTSNPVLTPWLPKVKSVLEMWFSGEEGGTSTARLLLGLADPSGHTDITWPKNPTDTIWAYNETKPLYSGDTVGPHLERLNGGPNGTTDETEGIYNGYRFFDKEGIAPQFAFGFGLSYTKFAYSHPVVTPEAQGGLNVSLTVTNTGSVAGSAVPQVYLGPPSRKPAGVQFAVRQLAGFDRVSLAPGASQAVSINVPQRSLQYWSAADQKWITAAGTRTVFVGDADRASSLTHRATVTIPGSSSIQCVNEQLSAAMVSGDVTVPAGAWCDMIDTTVTGDVTINGTGVRIAGSTIGGSLDATNMTDAADPLSAGTNVVCNSTIGGDLTISGSAAASPWNVGQCGANTVGGSLVFSSNAAPSNTLTDNKVKQNLVCAANTKVQTSDNTINGTRKGSCGA